jgi:glycosyltransferase involved in cell wall biosynthesis
MPRLSVLHAAKFYPPVRGGMETVVGDLCDGTAAIWENRVVAANVEPRTVEERVRGVDIVRAATLATASSVPLCPSLPRHLWRQPVDCVVLHEPNPIAGSALLLYTPAPHLVVWHHSDLVRPAWAPATYGRLQRAVYRRADCVVVSSPNLAAASRLVQAARRVEVIPFGIPLERFDPAGPAPQSAADRLRSRITGPRVLFVGRFVYYKGVEVLIDAMAECPGTLVLVGEGPLESELRQRARRIGVEARVVFAGRVSETELPAYYQAADVFVLPSVARTEAFGVVQVEAMAAGLPVISTDLPTGVPWVNEHGVSGLVVPPGDAAALARALRRLLADDRLRAAMGRAAAARAEALFALPRMIETFRRLIEDIAGAGAARASSTTARAAAS